MADQTFFGIGKPQWDLINGFANWFAAAGSFAAAVVALYLANRAAKPSARVSVGHQVVVTTGATKPLPEFVVFRIVNTGDRPINVVQIGWKAGFFRKRFTIQVPDFGLGSKLPVELTHGQEASYFVPLSLPEGPWLE